MSARVLAELSARAHLVDDTRATRALVDVIGVIGERRIHIIRALLERAMFGKSEV